jgi:uncharacterized protein (TIGR02001 family)
MLLLFSLAVSCGRACADVSGSISVLSDYRYRGESLISGNPSLQADVTVDSDSGWYAGAFASGVTLDKRHGTQLLAYGGYAHALQGAWSWDSGVTNTWFSTDDDYDFAEAYAGIASEHLNAKVFWSPDYFGSGAHTLYTEVNGSYPIFDSWRAIAHLGYLSRLSGNRYLPSSRRDNQIGIAKAFGNLTLQLTWMWVQKGDYVYPTYTDRHSCSWVAAVSYGF